MFLYKLSFGLSRPRFAYFFLSTILFLGLRIAIYQPILFFILAVIHPS